MNGLGGNQRDLARSKNQKKSTGQNKAAAEHEGNKGLSLQDRKQRWICHWSRTAISRVYTLSCYFTMNLFVLYCIYNYIL